MAVNVGRGQGPNPAAPALGGLYAAPLGQQSLVPPFRPLIEPALWKNKYQGGALELTVNVALLAIAASAQLYVATQPLYINRPWKQPTQVEQSVNVAVKVGRAIPMAQAGADPTFYKRPAQLVDVSPNIAAATTAQQVTRTQPTYVNVPWKRWTAFDQTPNVTATISVSAPLKPRAQQDAPTRSRWTPFEQTPNLAAFINTPPPVTTTPVSPTYNHRPWRVWTQVEQYPNLAALTVVSSGMIVVDSQTFVRLPPQIDILPNVAVKATPITATTTTVSPTYNNRPWKSWTPVDNFPNLAVFGGSGLLGMVTVDSQTFARPSPQVELFPNIAARIAPPAPVLVEPIDPWINRRYPPQIDVFPNPALFGFAPTVQIRPTPEPTITKWYPPQIVEFPNIAFNFTNVIPVIPPTNPGYGGSGGGGGGKFEFRNDKKLSKRQRAVKKRNDAAELARQALEPTGERVDATQFVRPDDDDDEEAILLLLS